MNVRIEIAVNGIVLGRWTPQDFDLVMPACDSNDDFEVRAEHRQRFTARFMDVFALRMQPMLTCISQYELYLVFESDSKNIHLFPHTMREFEDQINKAS